MELDPPPDSFQILKPSDFLDFELFEALLLIKKLGSHSVFS